MTVIHSIYDFNDTFKVRHPSTKLNDAFSSAIYVVNDSFTAAINELNDSFKVRQGVSQIELFSEKRVHG